MDRSANEVLVRRYVQEILNEGNTDAVEEIVAPDFLGVGPGPLRMHGMRGTKYFLGEFMNAVGDATGGKWDYQIDDLIVEGNKVAVRMTDHMNPVSYQSHALSPERAEQRLRETGLQMEAHGFNTMIVQFRIVDGMIAQYWMETSPIPDIEKPGFPDEVRKFL